MDTQNVLIDNNTNGLKSKPTPMNLLDLPEEILLLIGYRTAASSSKAGLNLGYTCRYLHRLYVEDQGFWRALASPRLLLPYWWRDKPKPGCVYGRHKDWKSAYIAIRKQPSPFFDSVYVLNAQARELDPTLTHAWTSIKLFENGTFVRSELKTKTRVFPRRLFNEAVDYGEWRMSENKLVITWTNKYLQFCSFKIRAEGKEIVETGRTSAYYADYGWGYLFTDLSTFDIPLVYPAYGGMHEGVASHETIAALRLGKA